MRDENETGPIEEHTYYLTDANGNVVMTVDDAAHGLERIFYNAYGMPECFPFGDLNGDYTVTVADRTIFDNIKNGGANEKYNILGDVDLDPDSHRDSDATDRSIMSTYYLGLTGGSNVLSVDEVANDIGYAGYIFNDESQNYHVRNREYSPQLGRFLQRDPIRYAAGMNLYQYVNSSPINYVDPYGLTPGYFFDLKKLYEKFFRRGSGQNRNREYYRDPGTHEEEGEGEGEESRPESFESPTKELETLEPLLEDVEELAEDLGEVGHEGLGILGNVPVAGDVIDCFNIAWYIYEGDTGEAALQIGCMAVPGLFFIRYADEAADAAELLRYRRYWRKKAPRIDTPGSRRRHYRIRKNTDVIEESELIYDKHGRLYRRRDNTDHGSPWVPGHGIPQDHYWFYGPYTDPNGKEFKYIFGPEGIPILIS